MRCINEVTLLGHVGSLDFAYSSAGALIARVSLATNFKNGEKEVVEWHSCVFFDKLAELCQTYVKKGSKLYVKGRLRTEKWEDASGVKRERTKIMGIDLIFLSFPDDGKDEQNNRGDNYAYTNEVESGDVPF